MVAVKVDLWLHHSIHWTDLSETLQAYIDCIIYVQYQLNSVRFQLSSKNLFLPYIEVSLEGRN